MSELLSRWAALTPGPSPGAAGEGRVQQNRSRPQDVWRRSRPKDGYFQYASKAWLLTVCTGLRGDMGRVSLKLIVGESYV